MSRRTNRSEKVILYRRVSTEELAESKAGLEAQRDRLEAEKTHRGWTDVEWIEDEGWPAKSPKRPGITEALRQLEAGEAGTLVVAKLDRLCRSIVDFSGLLKRTEREGWALIALDIDLDMTTATGRLIGKIVAVIAEWERKIIRERTDAALQAKKRTGNRIGGRRQTADDAFDLVVRLRKAGWTLQQIADELMKVGYPTTRKGRRWWPSTVKALLDSEALEEELDELGYAWVRQQANQPAGQQGSQRRKPPR